MKNIYILGGDIKDYLEKSGNALGETAIKLNTIFKNQLVKSKLDNEYNVKLILTKIADDTSSLVSNDDVEILISQLVADKNTKAIIFNIQLKDYNRQIKLIREERKDIFVVGFKTTSEQDSNTQYLQGLELLKNNSINLVLANDIVTHNNMIIAPEETRYCETSNSDEVLNFLTKIVVSRMQNHFTRSTVIEGKAIDWNSDMVPENLRNVVDHCINEGVYKPFLGKTAGHFAVKVSDGNILTSIRKTNFNNLKEIGLVKVESKNENEVIAHGFRPSVGGQSQRIIFKEHPDSDCIVHFHSPVREEFRNTIVPVKEQWPNECGSHECGKNTSNGLKTVQLGDGYTLDVVYLDAHGPNIVFNRKVPAQKVINFIDKHFDLKLKTGGLVKQ